jgi:hypothetical protein
MMGYEIVVSIYFSIDSHTFSATARRLMASNAYVAVPPDGPREKCRNRAESTPNKVLVA